MNFDIQRLTSTLDTVFYRADATASMEWLWRSLLHLLVKGEPVTVTDISVNTKRAAEEVRQGLATLADTEYDDLGRIVGHCITLRPTPHRFTVDGNELYTWCALDTLLFPAILGRTAQVESPCHATGARVQLTVEPDRITWVRPGTAVVSIVPCDDLGSLRSTFCNQVHFFVSQDAAQAWLSEHPDAVVIPVAEAHHLGRPTT